MEHVFINYSQFKTFRAYLSISEVTVNLSIIDFDFNDSTYSYNIGKLLKWSRYLFPQFFVLNGHDASFKDCFIY